MIEIKGAHNRAVCYTDTLDEAAESQIRDVCDAVEFSDSKIRIMPDVHAGKGCTIGTTMTVTDKVVPGMVGVDIGCGMETVRIAEREIDLPRLDALIHERIPCGRELRDTPHAFASQARIDGLRCVGKVNLDRARHSIGTLGGGNHFIEIDCDGDGSLYLVVHSGSRHLGCEVADHYGEEGYRALCGNAMFQIKAVIERLKAEGRAREIQSTVQALKKNTEMRVGLKRELAFVEGELFLDYIHDMKITQHFAALNRQAMVNIILDGMGLTEVERFTTVHNYIDTDAMILRKGAVSAKLGEKLLIPMNMRDGSLICIGRGNDDWNQSAPHGAGRLISRHKARACLSVDEYAAQMEGIYTTCVNADTLDESPMAYKSMAQIVAHITPTAEIVSAIKPIYNFKASE